MQVDCDGTADPQKTKLYVVETSYAFFVKRIGDPLHADASAKLSTANPFPLIRGSFSPSIGAASRETARAIVQVPLSTAQPPQGVETPFRHCIRLAEPSIAWLMWCVLVLGRIFTVTGVHTSATKQQSGSGQHSQISCQA